MAATDLAQVLAESPEEAHEAARQEAQRLVKTLDVNAAANVLLLSRQLYAAGRAGLNKALQAEKLGLTASRELVEAVLVGAMAQKAEEPFALEDLLRNLAEVGLTFLGRQIGEQAEAEAEEETAAEPADTRPSEADRDIATGLAEPFRARQTVFFTGPAEQVARILEQQAEFLRGQAERTCLRLRCRMQPYTQPITKQLFFEAGINKWLEAGQTPGNYKKSIEPLLRALSPGQGPLILMVDDITKLTENTAATPHAVGRAHRSLRKFHPLDTIVLAGLPEPLPEPPEKYLKGLATLAEVRLYPVDGSHRHEEYSAVNQVPAPGGLGS